MNLSGKLYCGLSHMDIQVLADQQRIMLISFIQTRDSSKRACHATWTRGTDSERDRSESELSAQLDNDDV